MSNSSIPKASPSSPVKRVFLQKETLQTFDKTWLPARLQPPKLSEETPYSAYLAEYEQYLHALQHMKGVHLKLTRRDPARAPAIAVGRSQVGKLPKEVLEYIRTPQQHSLQESLQVAWKTIASVPAIQFGSLAVLGHQSSEAPVSSWATSTSADDAETASVATVQDSAPGASAPPKVSAKTLRHRRANRARRLRQKKAKLERLALDTEVASAALDLQKSRDALEGYTLVSSKAKARRAARAKKLAARKAGGDTSKLADSVPKRTKGPSPPALSPTSNRKARRQAIYGVPSGSRD